MACTLNSWRVVPSPFRGISAAHVLLAFCLVPGAAAEETLYLNPQFEVRRTTTGHLLPADFNRDGKPDLATTELGKVLVYAGKGNGSFAPASLVAFDFQIQSFAVGDFNADGRPDIAASGLLSQAFIFDLVAVALGDGSGSFSPGVPFRVGGSAGDRADFIVAADLDADGRDDLVVANSGSYESTLTILKSLEDGSFSPRLHTLVSTPRRLSVGEFSGDSRPDLVVTGGAFISVLIGRGDASFSTEATFPIVPNTLPTQIPVAADLDADGLDEVALVLPSSLEVFQRAGGAWVQGARTSLSNGHSASAGDLTGDGREELVVGDLGSLRVLYANDQGALVSLPPTSATGDVTALADFNGDGKLDVAAGWTHTVYLGRGDGSFVLPPRFAQSPALLLNTSLRPLPGDVDEDGKVDLIFGADLENVAVALGADEGTPASPALYHYSRRFSIGYFNADLHLDVVSVVAYMLDSTIPETTVTEIAVYLGNGDGTFVAQPRFRVPDSTTFVLAVDLNRDRRDDLALTDDAFNAVRVFLGSGEGAFYPGPVLPAGVRPVWLEAGDFNLDGRVDLASANFGSGDVSIYSGGGDGVTFSVARITTGSYPDSLAGGDFNGDGRPDLAVTNDRPFGSGGSMPPDAVAVLFGRGDGTFAEPLEVGRGEDLSPVIAADLDADGCDDISLAYRWSHTLAVFQGCRGAGLGNVLGFAAPQEPYAVASADANSDGLTDLYVVSGRPGFVASFINQLCPGDADRDGVCDRDDMCMDTDQDGFGDPGFPANLCGPDNCPSVPNPDPDPCACGEPCDVVTGIKLTIAERGHRGSAILSWSTTREVHLSGFNVVAASSDGETVLLNLEPIPCAECDTQAGHAYEFVLPRRRFIMKPIFVEAVLRSGSTARYGPATRVLPSD